MSVALPSSWTEAPIGTLCVNTEQVTPDAEAEFIYVDIASVDRETKKITSPQRMLGKDAPSRARKLIKTGDTIVSTTRPNLNAVALVDQTLDGQIASTGFDVLRAPGLDPRWLGYLVRTSAFVDAMSSLVQGALYPAIRGKDVRSFTAPIAPEKEQKRIADKLDTVLTRVDAVNTRLARVAPLLKRFRQSVLAAATAGRLTEDWRAPNRLDSRWVCTSIGDIGFVTKLAGFEYTKFVRYDEAGDLKVLKAENVGKEGFRSTSFSRVDSASVATLTRSKVQQDDLLMVFVGAGTGQVGRVPSGDDWFLGPNIALIRVDTAHATPRFVELTLRGPAGKHEVERFVKSTAQPSLSMTSIRQFSIALPSVEEQTEIVRRVETLFAFADRLEARLAQAQTAATRLTPALLAKAFRGELVPQDPNDEPAAELLRRLQAERATAPKASAGRGRKAVVQSEG